MTDCPVFVGEIFRGRIAPSAQTVRQGPWKVFTLVGTGLVAGVIVIFGDPSPMPAVFVRRRFCRSRLNSRRRSLAFIFAPNALPLIRAKVPLSGRFHRPRAANWA